MISERRKEIFLKDVADFYSRISGFEGNDVNWVFLYCRVLGMNFSI